MSANHFWQLMQRVTQATSIQSQNELANAFELNRSVITEPRA